MLARIAQQTIKVPHNTSIATQITNTISSSRETGEKNLENSSISQTYIEKACESISSRSLVIKTQNGIPCKSFLNKYFKIVSKLT